jgi:large subunit ribosomal protein L25
MSEKVTIKAQFRKIGRHNSRTSRKSALIPAVLYGPKFENLNIMMDIRDIQKYGTPTYANMLFDVDIEGGKKISNVMFKTTHVDALSRRPLHVDFYVTDAKSPVKVDVKVVVSGLAKGVADGGNLRVVSRNLTVRCLPSDIPAAIPVDVTNLAVGKTMRVSDLQWDGKVRPVNMQNHPIVTIG